MAAGLHESNIIFYMSQNYNFSSSQSSRPSGVDQPNLERAIEERHVASLRVFITEKIEWLREDILEQCSGHKNGRRSIEQDESKLCLASFKLMLEERVRPRLQKLEKDHATFLITEIR